MSSPNPDSVTLNDKKRRFSMPSTPALLIGIAVFVAILTYILPTGAFERMEDPNTGRTIVVPGTYAPVEGNPTSIGELFSSIFNGLVNASELIAFVFVVGGAFYVVQSTGAINAGLGTLLKKLGKGKEYLMIVMVAFSLGGATFGMAEETLPFVALCVIAAKAMGYDPIVGISMVLIGCYCGYSAGPLNPFNTGISQSICELPMFSGMGLRIVLMVGSLVIAIHHTLRYCKKLRKNQEGSELSDEAVKALEEEAKALNIEFTTTHKIVLVILLVALTSLVFGVIKYGWYFAEISALFMAMGVIVGLIYFKSFNKTMNLFMEGAAGIAGAAILMGLSRCILVVAESGMIMDTIVYGISIPLSHLPSALTAIGMYISQGFVNFLIPSSTGQAVVVMPIMSAVSDLVGVSRQTACMAFTCGDGFWNMITPTHAVVLGTLGIAGVSFGKWFKYALTLVLKWSVCIILVVATMIGYGPF